MRKLLGQTRPFAGPLRPPTSALIVHHIYPRIRLTYDEVPALSDAFDRRESARHSSC
jgi:hypothetical protein